MGSGLKYTIIVGKMDCYGLLAGPCQSYNGRLCYGSLVESWHQEGGVCKSRQL